MTIVHSSCGLLWQFSTMAMTYQKKSKRLTIVHCGCGIFWQYSTIAMTLQILALKGWQFYTMAVTFFYKYLLWTWWYEIGWQFYHFISFSNWRFSPMAMPFINQGQLTYGIFFCENYLKIQFDKFTPWLWVFFSFWQFSTLAVNFFWQFYNAAFTQKIKQILVDNFTTFCFKFGWQFYFLTKVL